VSQIIAFSTAETWHDATLLCQIHYVSSVCFDLYYVVMDNIRKTRQGRK